MFVLKTGLRADKKTLGNYTIIHGGYCCRSIKLITIILVYQRHLRELAEAAVTNDINLHHVSRSRRAQR